MLRGCELSGVGGTGALLWLLFALFPIHPTPGAPPGRANGKEPEERTSSGWLVRARLSARPPVSRDRSAHSAPHSAREQRPLDSCTNLCTPLCYIECIYVGNMLASPLCRCRASRAALSTGPLPGRGPQRCPPFPTKPPPAQASPCQYVRLSVVLSSVHASIGLRQPSNGGTLATSCTYDCKMVNVVYYIWPRYIVYIYVYIYIYIIYMKTVNVKTTSVLISILLHTEDCVYRAVSKRCLFSLRVKNSHCIQKKKSIKIQQLFWKSAARGF